MCIIDALTLKNSHLSSQVVDLNIEVQCICNTNVLRTFQGQVERYRRRGGVIV